MNTDTWSCVKSYLLTQNDFEYATILKQRIVGEADRLFKEASVLEAMDVLERMSDTVNRQVEVYIRPHQERLMDSEMHKSRFFFSEGRNTCRNVIRACYMSRMFSPNDTLEQSVIKAKVFIEENRLRTSVFDDPLNSILQLSYDYPVFTNDIDPDDVEELELIHMMDEDVENGDLDD